MDSFYPSFSFFPPLCFFRFLFFFFFRRSYFLNIEFAGNIWRGSRSRRLLLEFRIRNETYRGENFKIKCLEDERCSFIDRTTSIAAAVCNLIKFSTDFVFSCRPPRPTFPLSRAKDSPPSSLHSHLFPVSWKHVSRYGNDPLSVAFHL